jgi:hypothetical protein
VLGWEEWLLPVTVGWLAILLLLGGKLVEGKPSRQLFRYGAMASLLCWVLCQAHSDATLESRLIGVLFSFPYLICLAFFSLRLVLATTHSKQAGMVA